MTNHRCQHNLTFITNRAR